MMEKIRNSKLYRKLFPELERLEVYLLAADNAVGKRQLRPIFRRKRNRQVLTREQVTAIKRGRRVLRQEMKERGIKRREDFEAVATNLGLYFDRGFLWMILLWFLSGNTAVKILATTTIITTTITVMQPVIEYVTEYVTEYITQYVTEYVTDYLNKDQYTIHLSDDMMNAGFQLSETPDFADPRDVLFAEAAENVPCTSIFLIPADVDTTDGSHNEEAYFAYTFYCRYINKEAEQNPNGDLTQYAINYDWGLRIHNDSVIPKKMNTDATIPTETVPEGEEPTGTNQKREVKVSDAVWVMIIQDGEVILKARAEVDEDGNPVLDAEGNQVPAMLPTKEMLDTRRVAFFERPLDENEKIDLGLKDIDPELNLDNVYTLFDPSDERREAIDDYFDTWGVTDLTKLMLRRQNWRKYYTEVARSEKSYGKFYRVIAEDFVSDRMIAERTRTITPWIEGVNEVYHKYTVVFWLEGDDPQCTNDLMDGYIGLNFQIKGEEEKYEDVLTTPTIPGETP